MKVHIDADTKLKQIEEAQSWLRGLGLKVDNSRYDLAKKLLKRGVHEGEIDEDQMLQFQGALQDLDDFLQVHELLQGKSSHILEVLGKTLKGAVGVIDEAPGKPAAARNYMFELSIAAGLVNMGFDVRFDSNVNSGSDCILNLGGADIYVECKRSLGDDPRKLLHEAFGQIQTRCTAGADEQRFGIAAVCYTPLFTKEASEHGPLVARTEELTKNMSESVSKLRFKEFSKYCPPGLGVVTQFTLPFWEADDMHLTLLRRTDFHLLASPDLPVVGELKRNWRSPT